MFVSVVSFGILVVGFLLLKSYGYQPIESKLSAEQTEKYKDWKPIKRAILPIVVKKDDNIRKGVDRGLVEPHNATNTAIIREFIRGEAIKHGIDQKLVDWIVKKESNYNPLAVGDDGNSRGLWMISSIYNPQVSDKCAFDVECSTAWAMKELAAGNKNKWSVVRFCFKWYTDCPL